jgi:Tol biopolymer transport system component
LAAAAAVVVLVLAVAAGRYLGQRRDEPGAAASPTPSDMASATASPAAAPSGSPTASASPTPTSDLAAAKYGAVLSKGWRPTGTSIVVAEQSQSANAPNEQTVLAVPADGAAPTKLARLVNAGTMAVSRDGRRVVTMALTDQESSRLAVLDLLDGTTRWLTADERGVRTNNPVFSFDGATVYYGMSNAAGDLGLFQLSVSGGAPKRIHPPVRAPLVSIPRERARDGLLVWGGGYEGASVEVLDLNSGKDYSARITGIAAVRDGTGPRFLLAQGGGTFCCRDAVVWDHLTDSRRPVFTGSAQVLGLAWAPDGVRVVAAARGSLTEASRLAVSDRDGATPRAVAGSDNARWPLWLNAGIAYLFAAGEAEAPATELRIIDPGGGAARALYRAASGSIIFQYGYVSP